MSCKYDVVLFDVDGTLFDTELAITSSIKMVLKQYNLTPPADKELKLWIGPPFRQSMLQYNLGIELSEEIFNTYRKIYEEKSVGLTKMYDGVEQLLKVLKSENVFVCTASSKQEHNVKKLFEEFGITKYFDDIVGGTFDGKIDTKEQVMDEVYKRHDLADKNTVMIGDRKYDAIGAKYKNIDFIGCLYGFGTYDELKQYNSVVLVKNAAELIKYLIKSE